MSEIKKTSSPPEILLDFGEEFGALTKVNISEVFVDIHAFISPLDPLNKEAAC